MPTKKQNVLIYLFNEFRANRIPHGIVTSTHVVQAINATKTNLSTNNPANFLKDIVRSKNANSLWPQQIAQAGFTARQRYDKGKVFEFIRYTPGQTQPFPSRFAPNNKTPVLSVQSASIPYAVRRLGRKEESWLMQVIVYLRILESHLSIFSPDKNSLRDITHLQMSMKTSPEIDAVFLASYSGNLGPGIGLDEYSLVICEAKQINERILEDQIREQIRRVFVVTEKLTDPVISRIRPFAVTIISAGKEKLVYAIELESISRNAYDTNYSDIKNNKNRIYSIPLNVKSDALYRLKPVVKGIN